MKIGIDLGTTNSAVAYVDPQKEPIEAVIVPNREGERTTPSVILFEDGVPVVGTNAKDSSVSDPQNTVDFIKRQMGNKNYEAKLESGETFTAEELSAMILKRLKEDVERELDTTVTDAVITVPAYFDDAQRQATIDAGKIAGLNVMKVINEPTAAALAYGMRQGAQDQHILVYDLGGGTFDVTVLTITDGVIRVRATGGDRELGGFEFDNQISNYLIERFEETFGLDIYDDITALQELKIRAEKAKKMLSTRKKATVSLTAHAQTLKEDITKEQFEQMIAPLLDKTVKIMEECLEDAALSWSEINKVLLIGGSTRIPAVQEMIKRVTSKEPSLDVNPDEAVAAGAAIQTLLMDLEEEIDEGFTKPLIHGIVDVNSHSLGTIMRDPETMELVNCIILPRNTELPASQSDTYYTSKPNQTKINLRITEGEDTDPDNVRVIGSTILHLDGTHPIGSPFRVTISYDENGMIHATAYDETNNTFLGALEIDRTSNLDDDSIEEKQKKFLLIDVE